MTQAQYARHRNQSPQYISKLAKAGLLPVWPKKPSRRNGTLLYTVGVDSAKATIYGRLKIAEASPGFCHFRTERTPAYFEQPLSETLVTTYSRGTPVREWRNTAASVSERVPAQRQARRKGGVRGEALDCRVYVFAALQALIAMRLSLRRGCERVEMLVARTVGQTAPRVRYSRWMQE